MVPYSAHECIVRVLDNVRIPQSLLRLQPRCVSSLSFPCARPPLSGLAHLTGPQHLLTLRLSRLLYDHRTFPHGSLRVLEMHSTTLGRSFGAER